MARSQTSTDKLEYASPISTLTDGFSMGGWFYFTDLDSNDAIMYNGDPNADGYGLFYYSGALTILFGGIAFAGGGSISTGAWTHLAFTRTAGTGQVWKDGATLGSSFSTTPGTPTTRFRTRDNDGGAINVKTIAEMFFYGAALGADEIVSLAKGYSPQMIRPASLASYWRCTGRHSPEIDLRGGKDLTVTGAAYADHPRIIYPKPRRVIVPSAAAPPGGIGIPIAAYHYNHHLGSMA